MTAKTFTACKEKNEKMLNYLNSNWAMMQEAIMDNEFPDKEIYEKLFNSYIKKLTKLTEEYTEKENYSVEKLVNKFTKVVIGTLGKCLTNKLIAKYLYLYFDDHSIIEYWLEVGDKVDDKDFEYLGDLINFENVSDDKVDTVLKINYPSYVIRYIDEYDEEWESLIPGHYTIGTNK